MFVNNDDVLICPKCGGEYLHQESVVSSFRDCEDHDGLITIAKTKKSVSLRTESKNLPGRRDCAQISFKCENCESHICLCFLQNKGQTDVYWRELK